MILSAFVQQTTEVGDVVKLRLIEVAIFEVEYRQIAEGLWAFTAASDEEKAQEANGKRESTCEANGSEELWRLTSHKVTEQPARMDEKIHGLGACSSAQRVEGVRTIGKHSGHARAKASSMLGSLLINMCKRGYGGMDKANGGDLGVAEHQQVPTCRAREEVQQIPGRDLNWRAPG